MERVQGVSPTGAGWPTKIVYQALRKRMGLIPKSKMLAAHHTPTLLATTWMDAVCASSRTVPLVLKELVQLN
jgi:hypothetical protein